MMLRRVCLLGALLAVGCKSSAVNDGNAIDLTITADATVTDADLASASLLDVEVTGAETYSNPTLSVAGKFDAKTRSVGLRYKPQATSGTVTLTVTIEDGSAMVLAAGSIDVQLRGGTQLLSMTLSHASGDTDGGTGDLGAGDLGPACGNGALDPGEACNPGPGSSKPCPTSAADCDDHNSCTTDAFSGSGCQAACTHTNVADATGCMTGPTSGVCIAGACCTGCVKNGACMPGASDATACGAAGNACFDCTQNSATATCSAGSCSGCDATSCTTEGRTCGTSSCGFNCGGCPDGCSNGTLTHYACVNKSCQMNGSGNCGLYSACASSTTCATSCTGDNGCVATAWCGGSACKPKVALGAACSAEASGDHECASPNVCSWANDGAKAYCTSTRCTACWAATTSGACGSVMNFGIDPRNYCSFTDSCHNGNCSGLDPGTLCDYGGDVHLVFRECGAVSCTNSSGGWGVLTGSICPGGSGTCKAGSTETCSDGNQTCWPCNSAGTDCNYAAPFLCN